MKVSNTSFGLGLGLIFFTFLIPVAGFAAESTPQCLDDPGFSDCHYRSDDGKNYRGGGRREHHVSGIFQKRGSGR
jgi:hypothetical protein